VRDESSGLGEDHLMRAFNDFIEEFDLREVHRVGPRFTWTNKQVVPVMSNIDRVLIATDWESRFPLTLLNTLTRLGSDHCPLLLDTRDPKKHQNR